MKVSNFRLLFFGSDAFSVRVLNRLLEEDLCAIGVVTKPRCPLEHFSIKNQLDRYEWPLQIGKELRTSYNIGLVASFGSLIDVETTNYFTHGLFNVHPSLLPQYRGSSPVQAAIRNGLQETGCTIMKIPPIPKFDVGDIILQRRIKVKRREYAIDLRDRLADLGSTMSVELLKNYQYCLINARSQEEKLKSYARKLKKEDAVLHFKSESSVVIDSKVRAYTGFLDIVSFCLGGLQVKLDGLHDPDEVELYHIDKLIKTQHSDSESNIKSAAGLEDVSRPGTMFFHKLRHILCIKCLDGRWIGFNYVTPDSKPVMTALDFYNGYLSKVEPYERRTDR